QVNVPVFNGWSARNGVKRSKISLKRAELQFEQDKLDLENTVNQAYVDVNTFSKSYDAAVKTLEARRLAYEYSKERFNVGLMNAFDFSQEQARVDNAEADVIRTKYDYIFRLKILEFYFGIPITLD
ncbi:MAG: TolC family protein, partial [Bacteroidota bacterium]